MEIAALTAFLAPFLPRLLKPVQTEIGDAVEQFGERAWQHAQELWARLRGGVEQKPSALAVAEEVAGDPEDQQAVEALARQLARLLRDDPALASELEAIWNRVDADTRASVTTVTAQGERSIAVGRDLSGQASTGDRTRPGET